MMAMMRMLWPLGLVVFGVVAAFMGLVVLATSLPSGEITSGFAPSANAPGTLHTISRASAPQAYWRKLTLLGFLPGFGGLAAAYAGWRLLSR